MKLGRSRGGQGTPKPHRPSHRGPTHGSPSAPKIGNAHRSDPAWQAQAREKFRALKSQLTGAWRRATTSRPAAPAAAKPKAPAAAALKQARPAAPRAAVATPQAPKQPAAKQPQRPAAPKQAAPHQPKAPQQAAPRQGAPKQPAPQQPGRDRGNAFGEHATHIAYKGRMLACTVDYSNMAAPHFRDARGQTMVGHGYWQPIGTNSGNFILGRRTQEGLQIAKGPDGKPLTTRSPHQAVAFADRANTAPDRVPLAGTVRPRGAAAEDRGAQDRGAQGRGSAGGSAGGMGGPRAAAPRQPAAAAQQKPAAPAQQPARPAVQPQAPRQDMGRPAQPTAQARTAPAQAQAPGVAPATPTNVVSRLDQWRADRAAGRNVSRIDQPGLARPNVAATPEQRMADVKANLQAMRERNGTLTPAALDGVRRKLADGDHGRLSNGERAYLAGAHREVTHGGDSFLMRRDPNAPSKRFVGMDENGEPIVGDAKVRLYERLERVKPGTVRFVPEEDYALRYQPPVPGGGHARLDDSLPEAPKAPLQRAA